MQQRNGDTLEYKMDVRLARTELLRAAADIAASLSRRLTR